MQINKSGLSIFLIALSWFIPSISWAQDLDPDLKALIRKGLEVSHSVNINDFDMAKAKVDQKLAKSVFLPKVTLNGSFTRLDDDISFDDDTQNLLTATQKLLIKEAAGIPFNTAFPENIPLEAIPNLQNKNILKSNLDLDWVLFSGLEASNALNPKNSLEREISGCKVLFLK